jgi:eukaryotic-like serine/threonine-protein kinase
LSAYPKLQPGDILGNRYKVIRLLGRGGMGAVFLAEDGRLPGKLWAVKEIYTPASEYSAITDEARFLAECSHPGLAAVADFLPPDGAGFSYLIMEYIPGETLESVFRRENPFPWPKAAKIAIELCEVLGYLHEGRPRPVIHRDLKPSNIMIDTQGRIRLIDFGTARHYKPSAEADTVHWGTLGFAAPEQLAGKQTDARTDLYTLGAVLYYLLSGGSFYVRHSDSLKQLEAGIPACVISTIKRLLEEAPEQRYQRAIEVRMALEPVLLMQNSDGKRSLTGLSATGPDKPRQQLIVVGGLTEGSGASFTAIALARVLNRLKITHSVVELPGVQPDLFQTLFGEKKAPRGFGFITEKIQYGEGRSTSVPWIDGFTEWVPLPPGFQRNSGNWSAAHMKRLIEGLTHRVVIMDAGSSWSDIMMDAVCKQADLILLVCGPSPVHLSRPIASQTWLKLVKLKEEGINIQVIANRNTEFAGKEEWLRALPAKPLCHIPEFPSGEVWSSLWRGELLADQPRVFREMLVSFKPIVSSLSEEIGLKASKSGPWAWLRRSRGL